MSDLDLRAEAETEQLKRYMRRVVMGECSPAVVEAQLVRTRDLPMPAWTEEVWSLVHFRWGEGKLGDYDLRDEFRKLLSREYVRQLEEEHG